MSGTNFVPDPSWPSIVELATSLWGQPTEVNHNGNEYRFGAKGSKSVLVREAVFNDYEAGTNGGYLALWHLVFPGAMLPPRTNGHFDPKTHQNRPKNGSNQQNQPNTAQATTEPRRKPWEDVDERHRYPYQLADGSLVLEVYRTLSGKPRFRQRAPDGLFRNGEPKWRWTVRHVPDHDKLLYRLPALLKAGAETVWIAEGEKDVENVTRLGLVATTNIGGAGKWRDECARFFLRRHVVVLPDHDPQSVDERTGELKFHPDGRPVLVGQDHAEAVARSLHGVAASVRVLHLPGLPLKGDVSDWIEAGGTREQLEQLARDTPLWTSPPAPPEPPEGQDDGPGEEWVEPGDGRPEPPPAERDPGDIPPELVTEQYALRLFVELNKDVLRFNHATGLWLIWAEHYWKPDERKLAFSWALNLARQLAAAVQGKDPTKARLVIEKVRFSAAVEQGARTLPEVATTQADWDDDPWLLGTPEGVVDLKTGEMRAGLPTDMISRVTAVTPSLMPDCPTWIAFLTYAMRGDDGLLRFVQRYFGYGLTGLTQEEIFLFVFGPGGAGKGTMVETIASLMGDYSGTLAMEVLTGQSRSPVEYYRASMAGKRLLVSTEPERGVYWAEGFVKEITGGDSVQGRHPMGRPFTFKPSHKLVMEGNHMPRLKGQSTGMQRRLRILPFTRKPVTVDRELKAKLLAEGPGILRWLIEGCLAWQKIGLSPPDEVLEAGSRYFETQDVFKRWVDDRCILDANAELAPSVLNKDYNLWAHDNNEPQMNGNDFSEALDQFECDPPLRRGKSGSKRWVRGLMTKPLDQWGYGEV